jgi:uncharacterized damage-inducible protein DinB
MKVIPKLLQELAMEAETTRKMLSRIPEDKYDWQPHPKSMTVRQLATHVAEIPGWIAMTIATDGLNFADAPYEPLKIDDNKALLAHFEENLAKAVTELENVKDEAILEKQWQLKAGDQVLVDGDKWNMIRVSYAQEIHHRAQLGVFLRLLNVPIPGSYGPSADEH